MNQAVKYGSSLAAAPVIREPLHAPVAHLVRGGVIEGIHYGSVVVLAADGRVELQIGDIEAAFYPRSALKPLQAAAMLRAGLPLDGELLSLAAASHSGEERHLAGDPADPGAGRTARGPAAQRPGPALRPGRTRGLGP